MTPTSGLEPSYIAIGLVALLLIACVLLYLSMRWHMRRIQAPTRQEMAQQSRGERPPSSSGPR